MSLHSYRESRRLDGAGFHALLMGAMREADTFNAARLRAAFPEVWRELQDRYNAPRGLLEGEHDDRYACQDGHLIHLETGEPA